MIDLSPAQAADRISAKAGVEQGSLLSGLEDNNGGKGS